MTSSNTPLIINIKDTARFAQFLGQGDCHLDYLEQKTGAHIKRRGNHLSITGSHGIQQIVRDVLSAVMKQLSSLPSQEVPPIRPMIDEYVSRVKTQRIKNVPQDRKNVTLTVGDKTINPRTLKQSDYLNFLQEKLLVFSIGPAGTGKTWLAVAQAVNMLLTGAVDKIILSRPAVEAGEQLGFLPGDLKEKIDPYLQPLYDALHSMLPKADIERRMARGEIEIAPLAFMRGRTLSHAFIILDEAQNTTISQMKMFLTRFGEGSRMVITGDLTQIDLPAGTLSGLKDAMETLKDIHDIGRIRFHAGDVVRHPLVASIVQAYEEQHRRNALAHTRVSG